MSLKWSLLLLRKVENLFFLMVINILSIVQWIYWRCSNRQCSAQLILQNSALIEQTGDHSHLVDRCDGIVEKLKSSMKKRALEEVTQIPSIYNDTLVDIATNYEDVDVAQKMPTFAVTLSY